MTYVLIIFQYETITKNHSAINRPVLISRFRREAVLVDRVKVPSGILCR